MAKAVTTSLGTSPAGVPVVNVSVTWTDAPIPASVNVFRIANGVRSLVRTAAPLALSAGRGTLRDYEAPFGATSLYVVQAGTGEFTGGAITPTSSVAWLVHPGLPEWSVPLLVEKWPTWQRPVSAAELQPISRVRPIVVSTVRQSARGELGVLTDSLDGAARMERILSGGVPLLLNTGEGQPAARWVAVGDVSAEPIENYGAPVESCVAWSLPLTEVDPPTGVSVAAWTFQDSNLASASFGETLTKAPTFADRAAGAWA